MGLKTEVPSGPGTKPSSGREDKVHQNPEKNVELLDKF